MANLEIQLKSSLRDKKKSHAVPGNQTIDQEVGEPEQVYGAGAKKQALAGKAIGTSLNTSSMTALHRDATATTQY